MFVVIREYEVRDGSEAAFEALHGAGDAWVERFGGHAGHLDTQRLLADQRRHYLMTDRRDSAQAYADFLDASQLHYPQLDRLGDAPTRSACCVGRFRARC